MKDLIFGALDLGGWGTELSKTVFAEDHAMACPSWKL